MKTKELLNAWDNGDTVILVEMGGMSADYEHAIQKLAIEFIRYMEQAPFAWSDFSPELWERYKIDMEMHPTFVKLMKEGYSGAQWGAALQEASIIVRSGYERAIASAAEERLIKVNKTGLIEKKNA
jgi:hypothetical protein